MPFKNPFFLLFYCVQHFNGQGKVTKFQTGKNLRHV